jgi:hypothetical protein
MRKQISFVLVAMLIFAGYLFINAQDRSKILKFSHKQHVKEAEIACADCHTTIENSTKAEDRNFPAKEVCANCHDVEDEENCTLCHVDMDNLASFANPVRTYFFNHKKHVADEKFGCEKCHAGIENAEMGDGKFIPPRENCNSCHDGLGATMECMTCHRLDTQFRPDSHIPIWSREHMVQVRSGGADCAHCHTNNYCQQCHESTDLISTKILPNNFYANYSPQAGGKQTMVMKTVHDLNYRYIHQLDAAGKEKNCRTCHETSAYCSECHDNGGATNQIRPAWHGGPDWGAIALGVGTGGGRHAQLAKRDIERCAACHDMQGADPSCLLCHTDFDGIKNTNPRTHEPGFSNRFGEDSDFHNDEGAVCFMCHTRTNQPGVGFCGYCHGPKH